MNERPLLAELDLVDPWCTKVPLNAVAHSTSASPAFAGAVSGRSKGISAGRCQNLQALALLQPSKEHRFFRSNKLPRGSMDGENLTLIFSPCKADPLIKSAKAID